MILDKYKEFLNYGLLNIDDINFIFINGPCCIHGALDDVIDDFYTNLDKLKKSNIAKTKIDNLKNKFEDLLRQAAKSTFGKAGLQYSNRYISKNASIIAEYQNPNLIKNEKPTHLKYNQQKLTNLKKARQDIIVLSSEKVLKEREDMYSNLSKSL